MYDIQAWKNELNAPLMIALTLCILINNCVKSDERNGEYWERYAPSSEGHHIELRIPFMEQHFMEPVNACATLVDLPFHKTMNPPPDFLFSEVSG